MTWNRGRGGFSVKGQIANILGFAATGLGYIFFVLFSFIFLQPFKNTKTTFSSCYILSTLVNITRAQELMCILLLWVTCSISAR